MLRKKQKHVIAKAHQGVARPDCVSTHLVPSLTRFTARSLRPFVCGRYGVAVSCRYPKSLHVSMSSLELSVYTYFGVICGPRNRLKHSFVDSADLSLTGWL